MASAIVLGSTGLVGSAVCVRLQTSGFNILRVHSRNYDQYIGARADVLINCNGNAYRFRANQDPAWDYQASVMSVARSLEDFSVELYLYVSTIDVYLDKGSPTGNHEGMVIDLERLDVYGRHKRQAEELVQEQAKNPLILRLGTAIGDRLKKGPLYDMLSHKALHMSLDSELSFVDTDFMSEAVEKFIATRPPHDIINLTGTGSARLRDLVEQVQRPVHVRPEAKNVHHHYNINNQRLQSFMRVPTSLEMARRVLSRTTI